MNLFSRFATYRYRWVALAFLSLGLAIVIIDNTVLNVAIPYIIRDLNTSLDALQWVISGYALIIATLLISAGRLGDLLGRKKVFLIGLVFFAVGSFIASIAGSVAILFVGEALIEAVGAAMMMTSSLSLLATEFQGSERAKAFGLWGAIAGLSATFGPLLGGYFTTYHSWRWSLRINVIVALIAIIGSIFIKEAKGEGKQTFDWVGMLLSGIGLFSLVFGFIEGRTYGWWAPNQAFVLGNFYWNYNNISVIPFAFLLAIIFLALFVLWEYRMERQGNLPLIKLSSFKLRGYGIGLATLAIISLGQFGVFFIMPIFLQSVLGLNALETGYVFLSSSAAILITGPLSGLIAARTGPKWIVTIGMFLLALGTYLLIRTLNVDSTGWSLAPALIVFGMGIGTTSAQLTNLILSSVPIRLAGEASAANSTVRQIGSSIGIAILGTVLAGTLTTHIAANIQSDDHIPQFIQEKILLQTQTNSYAHAANDMGTFGDTPVAPYIQDDINTAMMDSAKTTLYVAFVFSLAGALFSLLVPNHRPSEERLEKREAVVAAD